MTNDVSNPYWQPSEYTAPADLAASLRAKADDLDGFVRALRNQADKLGEEGFGGYADWHCEERTDFIAKGLHHAADGIAYIGNTYSHTATDRRNQAARH